MARITILGTGAMGSRLAQVLLKAGHKVTVWNRSASKTDDLAAAGATVAVSPKEAVVDAEFVLSMLRDDSASREVWLGANNGALAFLPKGAIAIDLSTVTPGWSRDLAQHCADRNIAFLDAPVVGSRPQAESSQLIFLVGGDMLAYEASKVLFETLGKASYYVGAAGSGAVLKLAVNALLGVQVTAIAEILGLFRRLDIDTHRAMEVVTSTPVISPSAALAVSSMLASNFAPLFPVELIEKDLGYLLEVAEVADTESPMVACARQVFQEAIKKGFGDEQMTVVANLYS